MKKRWVRLTAILISVLLLSGLAVTFIISQRVPTDDPEDQSNEIGELNIFPTLIGTNLLFNTVHIPTDLAAGPKLIIVAYGIEHRTPAYNWLGPLKQLNEEFPQLSGYFVPLFPKNTSSSASFLIGGMALATRDIWEREDLIVVFTDVEKFNDMVDVDNKENIQLFLVDDTDRVVWNTSGDFEVNKLADLRTVLGTLLK